MEGMEMGGLKQTADFHLDPNKQIDPVERLVEDLGPDDAFDRIMDKLEQDPNNVEIRREAALLVNRFDDLSSRLKQKIQH